MYGLITEEINHSYDGGLYAEQIRNRTFLQKKTIPYWHLITEGTARAAMNRDTVPVEGTALSGCLKLEISSASTNNRAGIYNDGYWGIAVKPNNRYIVSFFAKADEFFEGPLTFSIENNINDTVYASAQISGITDKWKKYTVEMITENSAPECSDNHFSITSTTPGVIKIGLVSLFPPTYKNRENGNRVDLMSLMAKMHPRFLRFPGGNYLEGNVLENRFDWKKTIGPIEQRPGHMCDAWGYPSSDGMGLMEFMYWCEDLGMEPVLAVYDGLNLSRMHDPITGDSLKPYVQDALDEVEFLTGDKNTKWGKLRIDMGRKKPFRLKYVEIGNEDFFDFKRTYDERYKLFQKAFREKYPDMVLIASSDGFVNSVRPDMEDHHAYMKADNGMGLLQAHLYDNYDRKKPALMIGEYAFREGSPTTNMLGGIYDAAYLTGLERNADIVRMSCFAPIFVNVNKGAMQWESDLIGYDTGKCYGSPSFWIQSMFSGNLGTELPASSISHSPVLKDTSDGNGNRIRIEEIYYSATMDDDHIYLKLVNAAGHKNKVQVSVQGKDVRKKGTVTEIAADSLSATNSINDLENIIPSVKKARIFADKFIYELRPYSVTVIKLLTK
jgi:alpha-N-arabinofuranosidase